MIHNEQLSKHDFPWLIKHDYPWCRIMKTNHDFPGNTPWSTLTTMNHYRHFSLLSITIPDTVRSSWLLSITVPMTDRHSLFIVISCCAKWFTTVGANGWEPWFLIVANRHWRTLLLIYKPSLAITAVNFTIVNHWLLTITWLQTIVDNQNWNHCKPPLTAIIVNDLLWTNINHHS